MVSLCETYAPYCLNPLWSGTLNLEVLNENLLLRNITAHFRIDPITKVRLFSLLISFQKILHQTIIIKWVKRKVIFQSQFSMYRLTSAWKNYSIKGLRFHPYTVTFILLIASSKDHLVQGIIFVLSINTLSIAIHIAIVWFTCFLCVFQEGNFW